MISDPRPAPSRNPVQDRLWLALLVVAVLGAADIADFLGQNPGMFRSSPGRSAGSVLGLVLWLALAACPLLAKAGRLRLAAPTAVLLAALLSAGSLLLVVVHAVARVGGLRPALGALLAIVALILAEAVRRRQQGSEPVRPSD